MKAPIFQVTFMKMLESSFSKFIIFRSKIKFIFQIIFYYIWKTFREAGLCGITKD